MPCPQWSHGVGNHWLALGLLLLCVPTPGPALAFPNDVLARLSDLHHKDTNNHHNAHAKNSSSLSSSLLSFSSVLSGERVPLLSETVPNSDSKDSQSSTDKGAFRMDKSAKGQSSDQRESEHSVYSDTRHYTDIYNNDYEDYEGEDPYPGTPIEETQHAVEQNASSSSAERDWLESDVVTDGGYVDSHRHSNFTHSTVSTTHGESRGGPGVPEQKLRREGEDTPRSRDKKRCIHCEIREGDRRYRVESIKRQILKKLHLTAPPNMTGVAVPKALTHMPGIYTDGLMQDAPYGGYQHYDNQDDEEDDDEYSAPERVFTVAKPMPSHLRPSRDDACYFSIPSEVQNRVIQKAYLWFYVRLPRQLQSNVVEMRVLRLGPHSKRLHPSHKVVWSQKAYPEKAFGWKRVDVSALARRWAKHPSSNYGLEILAANGEENLVVLPGQATAIERGYEPILDIKVVDNHRRRFKRSEALTCNANTTEHRCCRYPLHVSFAEFGWDWVIAPTHVKADYCSGECRMTLQDQTPYSWISSQTSESGGSCCTPSKMSALPLLYFDQNGNVVFQMLQKMKIERCGCA